MRTEESHVQNDKGTRQPCERHDAEQPYLMTTKLANVTGEHFIYGDVLQIIFTGVLEQSGINFALSTRRCRAF